MQSNPKARTGALGSRDGVLRERAASALFVSESGRYLLQLRDNRPDIAQPGCSAFFGGSIEGDETPQAALRRELWEELRFEPRAAESFSEISITYPTSPPRLHSVVYFLIPIREADTASMVLREGRSMRFFTPEELELTPRVDPLGLAVLMLHARPADFYRL